MSVGEGLVLADRACSLISFLWMMVVAMSLALSVKKANPPSPFGEDLERGGAGERWGESRKREFIHYKFPYLTQKLPCVHGASS